MSSNRATRFRSGEMSDSFVTPPHIIEMVRLLKEITSKINELSDKIDSLRSEAGIRDFSTSSDYE